MSVWKIIGPVSRDGYEVQATCLDVTGPHRGEVAWLDLMVDGTFPEGLTHENAIGRVFEIEHCYPYTLIASGVSEVKPKEEGR